MDEIAAEKQMGKEEMETKKDQETIMETKKNKEAVKKQENEAGVAKIKAEYRLVDYKPKLETEYVSQTVKDQMEDATAKTEGADDGAEPPAKRVKLKGRNKKRPKGKRMDASTKMCSALIQERECSYGDRCKFSHDKKKFFETKPADIGPDCYLFETYGKCPYGLSCRFAKAHVTEELTNKVKDDVVDREKKISNVLKKDLQISLWKRTFDFSKADDVLDKVCPGAYHQRKKTAKKGSGDKPETPASSDKSLATSTGTVITEKSENTNENNQPGPKEAGIQNDQKDEVKTDIENGVAPSVGKDILINKDNINVDGDTKADTVECLASAEAGTVPNETAVAMDSLDCGDEGVIRLRPQEKKKIDFTDKLYLAPLTTVGNLPYRRICKRFGADITCGEMAVCTNLLQGQQSEWALLKRHESEDLFGVQLCGAYPDSMTRCAQLITETMNVDFIDINCGCPIDLIFNKGEGSALMGRLTKFEQIVKSMTSVMDVPLTVKVRTGIYSDKSIAHSLMPKLRDWNVALATVHGRSRVQRYTKMADWDYISQCAEQARPMPLFGNGDILSYEDANRRKEQTGVSGLMIARGALIKPWIFTEIKEQRHWDISSSERFDLLKDFANFGFDHWGSDHQGVENTRRFLLEWLSFLYRYIPVGILERVPQQINERPPYYMGRDDMETLMASPSCSDWIKISEMLLGPVPEGFTFLPKHKANAYK